MKLSTYPYVIVRLGCTVCGRRGQYRLARLAQAFGAEATLEAVVDAVSKDCPWRLDPRKYGGCGCYARDLAQQGPPDLPPDMRRWQVIKGGRKG